MEIELNPDDSRDKILIVDFEVFVKDWLACAMDLNTNEEFIIVNDVNQLVNFYLEHINYIWVGHNIANYDYIILCELITGNSKIKDVSDKIINYSYYDKNNSRCQRLPLKMFDTINAQATQKHSLKTLEGALGYQIKESDIPFDIDRQLTNSELEEVILYCQHDVKCTAEVFHLVEDDFKSQLGIIDMFHLDIKNTLHLTGAGIGAKVFHAKRQLFDDEWNFKIPECLELGKYQFIKDWYLKHHDYKAELQVNLAGIMHTLKFGGVHGSEDNLIISDNLIMADVNAFYPSLMIEWDLLSRCVPPSYRHMLKDIRDLRIKYKSENNPLHKSLKIIINSIYGASGFKSNALYDKRNQNSVCVVGQLMLVDLIDKLPIGCRLLQSNTDGILIKYDSVESLNEFYEVCQDWESRTKMTLEFTPYYKLIQKDVNNYIAISDNGKLKLVGGMVKKPTIYSNNSQIINEAIREYLINNISVRNTICNEDNLLINYQKVFKVSDAWEYAKHGEVILSGKYHRLFNIKPTVYNKQVKMCKSGSSLSLLPDQGQNTIIYNDSVLNYTVGNAPFKLDLEFYVKLTERKLKLWKDSNRQKSLTDYLDGLIG